MNKTTVVIAMVAALATLELAAGPNKGLTMKDYAVARTMTIAGSQPVHVSVLKRYAVSRGEEIVVLMADTYHLSDDPYAGAGWWSPNGQLGIFLQSDASPDGPHRLLTVPGNPWEGCLATVEKASDQEIVLKCTAGSEGRVQRANIRIDHVGRAASVTSFDPEPSGFLTF